MKFSTGLTEAEIERLALLAEECLEASEAILMYQVKRGSLSAIRSEIGDVFSIISLCDADFDMEDMDLSDDFPKMSKEDQLWSLQAILKDIAHLSLKSLRHGFESFHPNDPLSSNRTMIAERAAMVQVMAPVVLKRLGESADFDLDAILARKMRYLHHQNHRFALI